MNEDDLFQGVGVEVKFEAKSDFLKIKETLTRIGIASRKEKVLYQSCHILHKQGRYVVLHFKELFKLDGKETNLTDEDLARRNTIVELLAEWKLLSLVEPLPEDAPRASLSNIKVLAFHEKKNYNLVAKYQIGARGKKSEDFIS